MTPTTKRDQFTRGKGIFSATGPQSRFILFLIFVLVFYTLLLRIFQKLAAIVELPIFLPIALIALLAFIGLAGTLYSHRFVGPMVRIRKTLERVAEGDCSVTLRLRDADDPMLKDLVRTIGRLCEQSRQTHRLVQESARELFDDLTALQDSIGKGASAADMSGQVETIRKKQAVLDKAIQSLGT
jgi:nitrogen fixation/metabolism regulation signal transduction histidine kinase